MKSYRDSHGQKWVGVPTLASVDRDYSPRMSTKRPDGLSAQSYEARKAGKSPMISVTLSRAALTRLDELRGHLPRGTMIAMLIEYWDSKGKRRKRTPPRREGERP